MTNEQSAGRGAGDVVTGDVDGEFWRMMARSQLAQTGVVRRNGDGSLDEVVGVGDYHLEQMNSGHWSLRLGRHLIGLTSIRAIKASIIENDLPATHPGVSREWLPIESAPKDGIEVLGYWCNGEIHVGAISPEGDWRRQMDRFAWSMPTHWMPLPSAPSGGVA